jgi:tetratricopeptide (TPR) repeat protein
LLTLGNALWAQDQQPTAVAYLNESLGLFRQLGDVQGAAWAMEYLGNIAEAEAEYIHARELLNESLSMFREMGDKTGMAWALHHLGRLAQAEEENQHAIELFRDSVGLFYELGISRGVAWGLVGMASLANAPERAACLLGAAEGLFGAQNEELMPSDRAYYERILTGIRLQLSAPDFDAAHSTGRLLTEDQAIWYAVEQAV